MFYVSRKETYNESTIRWIFRTALGFSLIDLTLAIVDLVMAGMCNDYSFLTCDTPNVHAIKVVILCLYVFTVIHSIASIIIVTVAGNNAATREIV
jgi:hypothetical protein